MHAKFEGENLKIERAASILVKWVSIMWSNLNGQLGTVLKVSFDNVSNKPCTIFVKFDDSNAGVSAIRNSSSIVL